MSIASCEGRRLRPAPFVVLPPAIPSEGATAASSSKTTTVSTTIPSDFRAGLRSRLADEWHDRSLAATIVDAIDAATIETYSSRVPIDAVMTSNRLDYDIAPSDGPVDSIVVYAFGYRGPDGQRQPGPVNEAMAQAIANYVADHPTPIYAQTEPAMALRALGVTDVTEVPLQRRADGSVIYQSTADFTSQLLAQLAVEGSSLGRTAVVGFADHLGRCLLIAQSNGVDAIRSSDIEIVSDYDPESSQPWTRSRASYLAVDLAQRF